MILWWTPVTEMVKRRYDDPKLPSVFDALAIATVGPSAADAIVAGDTASTAATKLAETAAAASLSNPWRCVSLMRKALYRQELSGMRANHSHNRSV